MDLHNPQTLSLAEVELATGMSRELLRKWEVRFLFPQPARDARSRRIYSAKDVERLQLIGRLLSSGHRPRHVVPLPNVQLKRLLAETSCINIAPAVAANATINELLANLQVEKPPTAIKEFLESRLGAVGLSTFVNEDLSKFNMAVGAAWSEARLSVRAEHLYTQAIQDVLQKHLQTLHHAPDARRVLLTTSPGELHGLGLLGLHCALAIRGVQCINLGLQTPVTDLVEGAIGWNVDVVAVSVSACMRPDAVRLYLASLRRLLPKTCRIWAGGEGVKILENRAIRGIEFFVTYDAAVKTM